jgi:sodium-dependent phosphate transporter
LWVLFLSAISLVVGLATYGQRITRAMGKEMAVITPSRGFAAELSTAIVIMVAAQYGLPTSSSQCITGGILGIGLVEGVNGVNWALFSKTFSSWVMTLFVMGICTAALFAQGHAAP